MYIVRTMYCTYLVHTHTHKERDNKIHMYVCTKYFVIRTSYIVHIIFKKSLLLLLCISNFVCKMYICTEYVRSYVCTYVFTYTSRADMSISTKYHPPPTNDQPTPTIYIHIQYVCMYVCTMYVLYTPARRAHNTQCGIDMDTGYYEG